MAMKVEVEEEEGEEEEVEGAVGGMVEEAPPLPSQFLPVHTVNQARRTKVSYTSTKSVLSILQTEIFEGVFTLLTKVCNLT